jgi:hypothetical protein
MTMRRNNKGVAMMAAIVVVVMVMGLGLAFMGESIFRTRSEMSERHMDDGQRMCDTAVEQARRFLFLYKWNNTWSWNEILVYNQNMLWNNEQGVKDLWKQMKSSGQLSYKGMAQTPAQTWPEAPVPSGSKVMPTSTPTVFGVFSEYMGKGAWYMTVRDNHGESTEDANPFTDFDNIVVVSVVAVMQDGTSRAVEARLRFEPPMFSPQGAIVTNGTANIGGDFRAVPTGSATNADVMSNGSINFNGNSVTIEGTAYAFGSVSGAPSGVQNIQSGAPKVNMPVTDPTFYKPLATYILKANGSVTNAAGTEISPAGADFYNFKFQNGAWKVTGDSPLPPVTVYYIETDFSMAGNGTWNATLIVEKSVDLQGNSTGWSFGPAMGNVAIIAGKDLLVRGNSNMTGVLVAGEQATVQGSATLTGSIVATDKADTSQVVSTTNDFSTNTNDNDIYMGSATIRYPGPQSTFLVVPKDSLDLIYTRKLR